MRLFPALITLAMIQSATAAPFDFTKEIRINASPETVWKAITDPEIVKRYHFAPLHRIELKKDGVILYGTEARTLISGTITDLEEIVRLAHTFRFGGPDAAAKDRDPDTLVTYALRKDGTTTVLTVTHSGFTEDNQTRADVTGGWPHILGQMKTTLEGGEKPAP